MTHTLRSKLAIGLASLLILFGGFSAVLAQSQMSSSPSGSALVQVMDGQGGSGLGGHGFRR